MERLNLELIGLKFRLSREKVKAIDESYGGWEWAAPGSNNENKYVSNHSAAVLYMARVR
jgi:hypothetical protein